VYPCAVTAGCFESEQADRAMEALSAGNVIHAVVALLRMEVPVRLIDRVASVRSPVLKG